MVARMLDIPTKSAEAVLAILSMPGIGPRLARRVLEEWSTVEQVVSASFEDLKRLGVERVAERLRDIEAWDAAITAGNQQLYRASTLQIKVATVWDAGYPPYLARIEDHPLLMYIRGNLQADGRTVACIGTREPSTFGVRVARDVSAYLASNGWSIVSGLDIGIDTLAHESALVEKGHTVAVLANGLDTVYPKSNMALADQILESGGALVSEQPIGTPIIPRNLVQRDRLQSGMSLGTVVMQTDVKGGSMHTVRFTLTQGRLLFAPSPPSSARNDPKSQGIAALTEKTGRELANLVSASPDYHRLLVGTFGNQPPAKAIAHRTEYREIINLLESAHEAQINPREGNPRQMRLFPM